LFLAPQGSEQANSEENRVELVGSVDITQALHLSLLCSYTVDISACSWAT
jgi:hypothetical protein